METIKNNNEEIENRRQFFRVNLETPLCSSLTIYQFNERKLNLGNTNICTINISQGGLAFVSPLQFPSGNHVTYFFRIKMMDTIIVVKGNIVRVDKTEDGNYKYGVQFLKEEINRSDIFPILNKLTLALNRNYDLEGRCNLCDKECFPCNKSLND